MDAELAKLISAAEAYYNGGAQLMTDEEYDELLRKCRVNIFDYVNTHEREVHTMGFNPMTKVTDWSRFDEFNKQGCIITPKWDGCSIVAYYEDGKLSKILTRSDEKTGMNKTGYLRNKFPSEVNPEVIAILAEAVVPISKSATRANANGLVNSKYKKSEVDADLDLKVFDVITKDKDIPYIERIKLINNFNFTQLNSDEARTIEGTGSLGDYLTDGVVFYYGAKDSQILKIHSSAQSAVTSITGIELGVSESTGLLTPKFNLEPVVIDKINVRNVGNCGNMDTIKDKGLGVGAMVEVHLTKGVIPKIKDIKSTGELPTEFKCPECGKVAKEFQGKFMCKNHKCGIWTRRYKNVNGNRSLFCSPPRYNGKTISDKQREYVLETNEIFMNIESTNE